MVRTQIYLTTQERKGLAAVSKSSGKKQSELIRDAVDMLLAEQDGTRKNAVLKQLAGVWRNRRDLPDFAELRRELDRKGRP